MVNKQWTACWLFAYCLSGSAWAQAISPQAVKVPVTVSTLDAIMQERIVYKAMADRAKERAELGRYDDKPVPGSTLASAATLPQLAWRRATASGWLAKFVLTDGSSLIAGVGEPLPGGLTVAEINGEGVKLKRGDELVELTAATTQARPAASAAGHINANPATFRPQPVSPR